MQVNIVLVGSTRELRAALDGPARPDASSIPLLVLSRDLFAAFPPPSG